jgi:hypothetical protein
MSRKSFGEFMQFSPKGLDTFKIQTEFKCSLFPIFFKLCWEFQFLPKREVVPFEFTFHLEMFGNFWNPVRLCFLFLKLVL